jgi:Zn-dependent peptidase ImmA (M78 family)
MSKNKQLGRIHDSRVLLQNPYAYVAGDDGELAAAPLVSIQKVRGFDDPQNRYTFDQIEQIARNLQNELWKRREALLGTEDISPINLIDAGIAFDAIGFEYQQVPSVGTVARRDVVGYIDANRMLAVVAQNYPSTVQRFTAAHELGHAVLHRAIGLLRERNQTGSVSTYRPPQEIEADQFASCFLMPKSIMMQEFRKRFLTDKFELNDYNLFCLTGSASKIGALDRRELSLKLANIDRFDSRRFSSLAEYFGLSTTAVAIRLEQLGVV